MPKNEGLAEIVLGEIFTHLIIQDSELEQVCDGDKDVGIERIKKIGSITEDTSNSFEIEYGPITGKGYDTHMLSTDEYDRAIEEVSSISIIDSGRKGHYMWFLTEKPEPLQAA